MKQLFKEIRNLFFKSNPTPYQLIEQIFESKMKVDCYLTKEQYQAKIREHIALGCFAYLSYEHNGKYSFKPFVSSHWYYPSKEQIDDALLKYDKSIATNQEQGSK